ncbi:putative drug exporter of the RND superfamily [Micrococcales bacterium KH10]|nr:putative drug exporter of the RND superfamily [Micrococcales bacterium KH10]
MAAFLYRLGRFSAEKRWYVLVAWLLVLSLSAGAYAAFAGTMSTAISIPGTETERVTNTLSEKFPDASGGTGTLVVVTDDGSPLTAEQRQDVGALLSEIAEIDEVTAVTNPFEVQEQLAAQASQVTEGSDELEAAVAELDKSQAEVDSGTAQLDSGQAQLDEQIEQARQAGVYDSAADEFNAQQAEIDATRKTLEEGQAKIDAGREQVAQQQPLLEAGKVLLDGAANIRLVSSDESAALVAIQFNDSIFDVPEEAKDEIAAMAESAGIDGVSVLPSSDISQAIPKIVGTAEIVGVVIAAIVLLVMLGTFAAAGLPLLNALIGVGVAALGALALSSVVEFISVTPVLAVMLGLAVGIDYSLFILNRHRRQLKAGMEVYESIGLANGTSGNAVGFAGSTVIVALLGLNLTGIPFLGLMGTVAAVAVAIAILVALTLTPAMLGLLGERALNRRERSKAGSGGQLRAATKPMSTWRAVATLVVGTVALGVIALPATSMRLGLPDGSSEPVESAAYQAFTTVADKFGPGTNGQLLVVATLDDPVTEETAVLQQAAVVEKLIGHDDVTAVAPIGYSEDGTILAFQVVPAEGPSAESTAELVHTLRDQSPLDVDGQQATIGVAGNASAGIDVSDKLADVLPMYLTVVIGLSLLILMVAFRSVLVPLTASLGFVLSLFASFGGITAIYQWGWLSNVFDVHAPGPILSFLPVIMIGVLFGLAMDYQLFAVTGMREAYAHGVPARLAVVRGLNSGRSVVTAAAIIMISVFGGFIFAESTMIRAIGFGLAFGVLIDAFVVRLLLIPAAMHLLGDAAWWFPKWLDRLVPDADIEGAQLERSHPLPLSHHDEDEPATGAERS